MLPKAAFFDVDDCVQTFLDHLCDIHYYHKGVQYTRSDLTEWNLPDDLKETFKYFENWIYISAPIINRVKDKIADFREAGYKIVFITARDESFKKHTEFSLALNKVKYDEILFKKNKSLQINRLAEKYDIQFFCDDKTSTVNNVAKNTNVPNVYLINMPSNRNDTIEDNVKRINNIYEIKL